MTPFQRPPHWPKPADPPKEMKEWSKLHDMKRAELKALGLDSLDGGKLWLFPAECQERVAPDEPPGWWAMNWIQRTFNRLFPSPPKERVVYTGELPPFLKEIVEDYLTATRAGEPFSFRVRMEIGGKASDVARCPHCLQKNRLDIRGIVGARCAACGLPLELMPKAKRKEVVQ